MAKRAGEGRREGGRRDRGKSYNLHTDGGELGFVNCFEGPGRFKRVHEACTVGESMYVSRKLSSWCR